MLTICVLVCVLVWLCLCVSQAEAMSLWKASLELTPADPRNSEAYYQIGRIAQGLHGEEKAVRDAVKRGKVRVVCCEERQGACSVL